MKAKGGKREDRQGKEGQKGRGERRGRRGEERGGNGGKGKNGGTKGETWRVPNPPSANPLVAERAFPTSDYWGRTGCWGIVAHVCGDPLSRYACRATRVAADFLRILGFFRCSSSIALPPPP